MALRLGFWELGRYRARVLQTTQVTPAPEKQFELTPAQLMGSQDPETQDPRPRVGSPALRTTLHPVRVSVLRYELNLKSYLMENWRSRSALLMWKCISWVKLNNKLYKKSTLKLLSVKQNPQRCLPGYFWKRKQSLSFPFIHCELETFARKLGWKRHTNK